MTKENDHIWQLYMMGHLAGMIFSKEKSVMKHKQHSRKEGIRDVFEELDLITEQSRHPFQLVHCGDVVEQVGFIYTFPLSQNTTPVQTKGIALAELETGS